MRRVLAIVLGFFLAGQVALAFDLPIVEGWTGDLDFALKADGAVVDLTGMTVELLLYKADKTLVDTASDVTVPDAANGVVRYSPDPTDLLAADTPHTSRFKVTDGGGKVVYFPSGQLDRWTVRSP